MKNHRSVFRIRNRRGANTFDKVKLAISKFFFDGLNNGMKSGLRCKLTKQIAKCTHSKRYKKWEKAVQNGCNGEDNEKEFHHQQETKPKNHKNSHRFYGLSKYLQLSLDITIRNNNVNFWYKRISKWHITKGWLQTTTCGFLLIRVI